MTRRLSTAVELMKIGRRTTTITGDARNHLPAVPAVVCGDCGTLKGETRSPFKTRSLPANANMLQ